LIRSLGEVTPGSTVGGVPNPVHMGIFSSQPVRPIANRPTTMSENMPRLFAIVETIFRRNPQYLVEEI
jgi:hypothetical protein